MDCNKTTNFLAELQRLCGSRDRCTADAANEEQCPMFGICSCGPTNFCAKDAKKTVQKWSNEHPKKTYAQDFFEKFPKAQRYSDGSPVICRKIIYGEIRPPFENCYYTRACYRCWNKPMEE